MSPRVLGAVLAVAAVSTLSIARLFFQAGDFYSQAPSPDGVTEFINRFTAMRAFLPSRGVIGYMTDPGTPPGDANAQAEYYLTQYAMAPVLVVYSPDRKFVIANFHGAVTTGGLRDRGFKLVREFGQGIALFENERVR